MHRLFEAHASAPSVKPVKFKRDAHACCQDEPLLSKMEVLAEFITITTTHITVR